ncbi:MAG: HAD-IIIC family phosphatase [Pseudomonadales bacterium]|nr:HAD-IIIC family phosphatase [Halioglobus sp.]MCP5128679.1 HAD-IIIC family phosphatase [Pseudomonadales bacterium]
MIEEQLDLLKRGYEEKELNFPALDSLRESLTTEANARLYLKLNSFLTRNPELSDFYCSSRVKIANLSTYNNDSLDFYLNSHMFLDGLNLELYKPLYNQLRQELLAPGSGLYRFDPEIVFLDLQLEDLFPAATAGFYGLNQDDRNVLLEQAQELFSDLVEAFVSHRTNPRAKIVVREILPSCFSTPQLVMGVENEARALAVALNNSFYKILKELDAGFVMLVEDQLLAQTRTSVFDEKMRFYAHSPFSQNAYCIIAEQLAYVTRTLVKGAKKCIVVDLDNTLWGGVLGEDGIEGISCGDSFPGNVHREFQSFLLELYSRGFLLAICSKNNQEDVLQALAEKSDLLLRERHFAAIKSNWNEKSLNIQEISSEINITPDHMVFIDDNILEIEKVKQLLPEVTCIHFPKNGANFRSRILATRALGKLSVSDTDRFRGDAYYTERKRRSERSAFTSVEDFIRSLEQVITVTRNNRQEVSRISQLTQRTNQFNMATVRLEESEVAQWMSDPACAVFSISVADKLGDSGLVGLAFVKDLGERWNIENFLMSCRILGREIETDFMTFLAHEAIRAGKTGLEAVFIASRKNEPFANFYADKGFTGQAAGAGTVSYSRLLGDSDASAEYISKLEIRNG